MTKPVTISNQPLAPGMDYVRLRQEGQQHIEKLAGQVWTDYNVTDPGITLLESLCYVITDLSYRLGFDIQDLLAANPEISSSGKQFFTAREILSNNPLTFTDYRKLLIDINGVKNAWLEKAVSKTPVFYNADTQFLTFSINAKGKRLALNGLYRVLLELEDAVTDSDNVIGQVRQRLNQHRNVGEDLVEIHRLTDVEITMAGAIELRGDIVVHDVLANIYIALEKHLSPSLTFYSLDQRLAAGEHVEDIFNGPALAHGFLDEKELSQFQRKKEIHIADIVSLLLDIDGVVEVNTLRLMEAGKSAVDWILELSDPNNSRPVLKSVMNFFDDGDIIFSIHGGARLSLTASDKTSIQGKVQAYQTQVAQAVNSPSTVNDITIPAGRYRNLTDYVSVQNELPANYGIGRHGLADPLTSKSRRAQARQLQAYLTVFDQLLINYLVQLENTRELLAIQPDRGIASAALPQTTYFSQSLSSEVAGLDDIISDDNSAYQRELANIVTDENTDIERMHRFLDHLLARHGQVFTPMLALYPVQNASAQAIPAKQRLLQDYADISHNRARGFDYTDTNSWVTNNVSGLKKRICRLLDIQDPSRRSLTNPADPDVPGAEGFHMIDAILLRPDLLQGQTSLISFLHKIRAISKGGRIPAQAGQHYTVLVFSHQYLTNESEKLKVIGAQSNNLNGVHTVRSVQTTTNGTRCEIDLPFQNSFSNDVQSVSFYRYPLYGDPYSCQLHFIFPADVGRMRDVAFRELAAEIISQETPAHITSSLHWLQSIGGNNPPVNTVPSNVTVTKGQVLSFTGDNSISVDDVDGNLVSTRLEVSSGNLKVRLAGGATISDGTNDSEGLILSGTQAQINAALATLTYRVDANVVSDLLFVASRDRGSDENRLRDLDRVRINITEPPPDNTAPVNTVPGPQTFESDTDLKFTGTKRISVEDVDGNLASTQLTVKKGILHVDATPNNGATISDGANDSKTLTLSGTKAQINAALATLTYGHDHTEGIGIGWIQDWDTLTVLSKDSGYPPLTSIDTVSITITNSKNILSSSSTQADQLSSATTVIPSVMKIFESDYEDWLQEKAKLQTDNQKIKTTRNAIRLLRWLGVSV